MLHFRCDDKKWKQFMEFPCPSLGLVTEFAISTKMTWKKQESM